MATRDDILKICDEPKRVPDGPEHEKRWGPCLTDCKKCQYTKVIDIAGRALAESLCADHTVALTLTYGKTGGACSQILHYPDIQRMMWRLCRKYEVRFIVAGEYGSRKGRAYWHCVLFFYGKCPKLPPLETDEVHWDYWSDEGGKKYPTGFVYVQKPDYSGMRYVVKYAVKQIDKDGVSTRKVQYSLKPPIGAGYWPVIADEQLRDGFSFSFKYFLPEARHADGSPVEFYAKGASAKLKWEAYRDGWFKLNRY